MLETGQIVLIICAIVACLVCCTRFYLRVIVGKRFEMIEFALIWALVMYLCLISAQLRIFSLLPTMQLPSHYIEAQKIFFTGTFFYIAALWGVKISIVLLHIQLTRRFERINFLAICTFYILLITWVVIYMTFLAACWPIERRWTLVTSQQCGPIIHAWDFWTHFSIHIATDIILCILPFPALLKVTETRLRVAICGVYSLAIIAIIVTIIRIVLLATNIENSIKRILILTCVEVAVCLIIGILPGVSSAFTKKYVQNSSRNSKLKVWSPVRDQDSSQTGKHAPATVDPEDNADIIELSQSYHHTKVSAKEGNDCHSLTGSTDQIISASKGGITKVTHIKVETQN